MHAMRKCLLSLQNAESDDRKQLVDSDVQCPNLHQHYLPSKRLKATVDD
jgi:MinD superfamily P-loop ATPase